MNRMIKPIRQLRRKKQMRVPRLFLLNMMFVVVFFQSLPSYALQFSKESVIADYIVAVVNDDVITNNELKNQIQTVAQQMRQQKRALPNTKILKKQVLDRLILSQLQLQIAERNNIRIDDETLNRTILNIAKQNNLSLSKFRDVLEQDGYQFENYRENIRKEITVNRLRQRHINSRILITSQEIDDFISNQKVQGNENDEYHVGHILLEVPEAASSEQVQAAKAKAIEVLDRLREGKDFAQLAVIHSDGQKALQGGDLGWRKYGQLPTLFTKFVTVLKVGSVSRLIRSPSGFHIIKLLDKRSQNEEHFITQTNVRHILLRTDQLSSDEEVTYRLTQLKQRIERGDDFSALAKSNSSDKGTAAKGGDLGWVNPGDLLPDFEEVMGRLESNEISTPFKTRFGWHIAQVLDRRKHDNTEDFRKNKAREHIRQRKIEEETQNWLRRIHDEAYIEIRL